MREGGSRNLLYSKSLHKTRGPIDVAVGSQPPGLPWDEWGHGWRGLWSEIYLQLWGEEGAGSWPSWRSSPAQSPSIYLCVCVRERVSEWECERQTLRHQGCFLPSLLKGRRWGPCAWAVEGAGAAGRTKSGKRSSRGDSGPSPWSGAQAAPHGRNVKIGKRLVWGVTLVSVSPASVEGPHPPSLALTSSRGAGSRVQGRQGALIGAGEERGRSGRSCYWKHLDSENTHSHTPPRPHGHYRPTSSPPIYIHTAPPP